MRNKKKKEAIENFLKKCPSPQSNSSKIFLSFINNSLNFGEKEKASISVKGNYLLDKAKELYLHKSERNDLNEDMIKEINHIEEIINQKAQWPSTTEILILLKDVVNLLDSNAPKKEQMLKIQHLLNRTRNNQNPFWEKLAEILLAFQAENLPWAKEVLYSFLAQDRKKIIFEIQKRDFSRREIIMLKKLLLILFKNVQEKFKSDELFKLYLTYWIEYFSQKDQERIKDRFKIRWSLNEIREQIKSPNFGITLPNLWFPLLYKRAPYGEVIHYLDTVITDELIRKEGPSALWPFTYYTPRETSVRDEIQRHMNLLKKGESWYERDLLLSLLEKQILAKNFVEENKEFQKPLFILQRKFYWEMLKCGVATDYAVFNLMKMGDFHEDLAWWIFLL